VYVKGADRVMKKEQEGAWRRRKNELRSNEGQAGWTVCGKFKKETRKRFQPLLKT
jgi:hypothetical protein